MRQHVLPLALLIAAGAVTGPAWGASADSNGARVPWTQSQDSAAASNQDTPDGQPLARQIQQLRQTFHANQQQLADQNKRLKQLEQTVAALRQRVRGDAPPATTKKPQTPDDDTTAAHSHTRDDNDQPDETDQARPTGAHSATRSDDAPSADHGQAQGAAESTPTSSRPADAIDDCPPTDGPRLMFDVFFQANANASLTAAVDKIHAADLSDWFALPGRQRLYIGRYGPCPLAVRRRDAVHAQTGLPLFIAAVKTASSSDTEKTSSGHAASAAHRATRNTSHLHAMPTAAAPFALIGVEVRGTQRYLGVAPHGAQQLHAVTWLAPGDRYAGWQLQAIQDDRAIFTEGHRTIAVRLPDRG